MKSMLIDGSRILAPLFADLFERRGWKVAIGLIANVRYNGLEIGRTARIARARRAARAKCGLRD